MIVPPRSRDGRLLALALTIAALTAAAPSLAAAKLAGRDSLDLVRERTRGGVLADAEWIALARRIAARRVEALGLARPETAEALELLGGLVLDRGDYRAADSVFALALEARRTARPADPHAVALALGWRAEGQRVTKQLALAESTAIIAVAALERAAPADTASWVRMRRTLGDAMSERGDHPGAAAVLEGAAARMSAKAHPDSVLLASLLRSLARAQMLGGSVPAATATLDRAAAIQEIVLGSDHPELATTHYFASFCCDMDGDSPGVRRHAERALAIREKAFGPEHQTVASTLSQLGSAVRGLSGAAAAAPYYERAAAILEPQAERLPSDYATALSNLGNNLMAMGEGERAIGYFERARAVRERVFGPGRGSGFWSEMRIAQSRLVAGQVDSARAALERLVAGPTRRSPLDESNALEALGVIAYVERRWAAAESLLDCSTAALERILGPNAPKALEGRAVLGAARLAAGDPVAAFAEARQVERGSREVMEASAGGMSEREALDYQDLSVVSLDLMAAVAREPLPDSSRRAMLDAVIHARLSVLDLLADERRSIALAAPSLAEEVREQEISRISLAAEVRELESARTALAREMVRAVRVGRPPDSLVAMARERREAAERALASHSARFRAANARASAGIAEVAAALPPGSVLVSYLRREAPGSFVRAAEHMRRPPPAPEYLALVLRAGASAPAIVRLGPAAPIDAAVASWVEACASPPPARLAAAAERRCRALGLTVRALVWDPLAAARGAARRIYAVPDGTLAAANLLALPDGRHRYLADGAIEIHRLDAERDLVPWGTAGAPGRGLLVIGDPDYDANAAAGEPVALGKAPPELRVAASDRTSLRFTRLPGAAAEIEEVGRLWRTSGASGEGVERRGAAASEAEFRRLAPGRRVLHLATHGFALGAQAAVSDSVVASAPPFAGGETSLRAVGAVSGGTAAARLRRSAPVPGLALAGANTWSPSGTDDGYLTAEEISSMNLDGVEWAVLSACETGLADPDAVEAVQGLHRAFRRAGLRTLIVSLWAVGDEDARQWMGGLYAARWIEHRDTVESVRGACRGVLAARRARGLDTHPFHWAGFVASGDWR